MGQFRDPGDKASDPTDEVLVAGRRVLLPGPRWSPLDWGVVYRAGRIRDVGPVSRFAGVRNVLLVRDATILPGFIDSHVHLLALAAAGAAIRLDHCHSIDDIIEKLAAVSSEDSSGRIVRGWGYDIDRLKERRHPTSRDLDTAASHRPVLISDRSGHVWVLNSACLREAGLKPPAYQVTHATDADMLGTFLHHDIRWIRESLAHLRPSLQEQHHRLRRVLTTLAGVGITTAIDATMDNDEARMELLMGAVTETSSIQLLFLWGASPLPQDPRKRQIVGRKLGIFEYKTGLRPALAQLVADVESAHRAGLPVAIHAISEEAIVAALHVLSQAGRTGSTRADRIEHASQMSDWSIRTAANHALAVCVNPGLLRQRGDIYLRNGPDGGRLHRYRSLSREGVTLLAASDAPAAGISVIDSLRAATTRVAESGGAYLIDESVSLLDALSMYTSSPAGWIGDRLRGELKQGAIADMVAVSGDWCYGLPADASVVATVVNGRCVFSREPARWESPDQYPPKRAGLRSIKAATPSARS